MKKGSTEVTSPVVTTMILAGLLARFDWIHSSNSFPYGCTVGADASLVDPVFFYFLHIFS